MPNQQSKFIILSGFAIVLGLVVLVSVTGLMRLSAIKDSLNWITDLHHAKSGLITDMHKIVNERTSTVYLMVLNDDPFKRDELFLRHKELANRFVDLRIKLQASPLSIEEKTALDIALQAIRDAQPVQEAIVDDVMDGNMAHVGARLLKDDAPLEERVYALFDAFLEVEQDVSHKNLTGRNAEFRSAIGIMALVDGLIVVLGVIVTFFVLRYTARIEAALAEEKQLAQITLQTMGDAVITTNKKAHVVYLNPAAEQLIGLGLNALRNLSIVDIASFTCQDGQIPIDLSPLFTDDHAQPIVLNDCQMLVKASNVEFFIEGSITPIRNESFSIIGVAIVLRDVTHSRNLASQLTWQATHDALTGLLNRGEFERLLGNAIDSAKREHKQHAMLYLDLDQFKIVNDTCGHFAGDKLLQQLTSMIQNEIRATDTLARLGGDEFGLLLEGCPAEKAERIAQHILTIVQGFRFSWSDKLFKVGVSIGLVIIDHGSDDIGAVLSAADAACYMAKEKGRNRIWMHRNDDADIVQRHGEMEWTSKIMSALEEDRFCLMKQRISSLDSKNSSPPFYELLVRMVTPNNRLVLPMSFIPAAERYGMMVNIDKWVIKTALNRLVSIDREEIGMVSINLSGQSFSDDHFLDFIIDQFDKSGADPERVCFEITETSAVANWLRVTRFMSVLRGMGCKFALDDFGSGMSSFTYLKNFPVDFIKIEGSFVRELDTNRVNQAMVEAIHSIGRVMNIKTIAEYIEIDSVLSALSKIGVDYAQGNILHKPAPL